MIIAIYCNNHILDSSMLLGILTIPHICHSIWLRSFFASNRHCTLLHSGSQICTCTCGKSCFGGLIKQSGCLVFTWSYCWAVLIDRWNQNLASGPPHPCSMGQYKTRFWFHLLSEQPTNETSKYNKKKLMEALQKWLSCAMCQFLNAFLKAQWEESLGLS